jgi:hypothetical protein
MRVALGTTVCAVAQALAIPLDPVACTRNRYVAPSRAWKTSDLPVVAARRVRHLPPAASVRCTWTVKVLAPVALQVILNRGPAEAAEASFGART